MQILYGVSGERRISEFEIPWLRGYENSRPVRIGNAASTQFQLDVYGEIVGAIYEASRAGLKISDEDWRLQVALLNFLETKWMEGRTRASGKCAVRGATSRIPRSWRGSHSIAACEWLRSSASAPTGTIERWKQTRDQNPPRSL